MALPIRPLVKDELLYPIRLVEGSIANNGVPVTFRTGRATSILLMFSAAPTFGNFSIKFGNSGDSLFLPVINRMFYRTSGFDNITLINNTATNPMNFFAWITDDPDFIVSFA